MNKRLYKNKLMRLFKPKYKFNPRTLQYEKIGFGFKRILTKFIPIFSLSVFLAAILVFIFMMLYDTPKEVILKAENKFLKQHFKEMNVRLSEGEQLLEELAYRDNYFYRITYNQDTVSLLLRKSGVGGVDRYKHLDGYLSTDIVKKVALKLDQVEKKLNIQSLSYNELYDAVKFYKKELRSLPFIQPIHTDELIRIGSFYGYRTHPIMRIRHMHEGLDLTAPTGTPVYASGDGVVLGVERGRGRRGYGNMIVIDHEVNGITTRYAHLSSINVKEGERVKRGQKIGAVGNTGLSTAPHLHYEIRIDGASVNPLRYMLTPTPEQYNELIKLALFPGTSFD